MGKLKIENWEFCFFQLVLLLRHSSLFHRRYANSLQFAFYMRFLNAKAALCFWERWFYHGNPLRGTLLFLLHAKCVHTHTQIRCGCIFPQCCWGYHLTLTRFRIDLYIISRQLNKSWVSCYRLSQRTAPLSGVGVVVCCKAASFPFRPPITVNGPCGQAELDVHAEQLLGFLRRWWTLGWNESLNVGCFSMWLGFAVLIWSNKITGAWDSYDLSAMG